MATLLFSDPACLNHDTGPGHPETPARLEAVLSALDGAAFSALERRRAPRATRERIALVHPMAHVEAVFAAIPESGHGGLDGDTLVSAGSGEAALRAAGAMCAAVDAVCRGEAANAFCAVRPPGHHAEPSRSMGFCLFNSVAVGALHARAEHGIRRIAAVDFDVHHGNGTQAIFWDDPDLFYASTHQMPLYPGSGAAGEQGAHGNVVNVPLAPMAGSPEFRGGMSERVLPALTAFAPELILISAGFDAHAHDPLANICLYEEDYRWVTAELLSVADRVCAGRVVSTLEGGYNLSALAESAAAHVGGLMEA